MDHKEVVIYFTIRLVRVGGYQRKGRTQHAGLEGARIFYIALQMQNKTLAIYLFQVQVSDFLPTVQRPCVSVKDP